MDMIFSWIAANPKMALASLLAIGWFVRHKGIGAGLLPGLNAQPAPKASDGPAIIPAPVEVTHPAVSVLRAGIDAGAANEVLPAVQKLIAPKA